MTLETNHLKQGLICTCLYDYWDQHSQGPNTKCIPPGELFIKRFMSVLGRNYLYHFS